MDAILQSTDLWLVAIGELLQKYSMATMNFVTETIGMTSNLSSAIKPGEGIFLELTDVLKNYSELLAFDSFQWQLLKIFLSILVTIIFAIFCAWYVYGERITDQFMSPGSKIENRSNFKYYSPNL